MTFEQEMIEFAKAGHHLVALRSKFRAMKEEQAYREGEMWLLELVQAGSNEKIRKATFDEVAKNDAGYQDLLGAIQLQHDAIGNREVDEQFHRLWAQYLIATAQPPPRIAVA